MRPLLAAALTFCCCAHPAYGPPDEERLSEAVAAPSGAEGRGQLQACDDEQDSLAKARNPERTESERLRSYMEVFKTLSDRVDQNQKVFSQNPDIAYSGGKDTQGSAEARQQASGCRDLLADTRREFEELVRGLFEPLLVMDVQNGRRGRSARISLNLLRSAVQELGPTDQDSLLERLNEADKVLQGQRHAG